MRVGVATLAGLISLCQMWDLWKAYETLKRRILKEEAAALKYPMGVLNVAVRPYRWARTMTYRGRVGKRRWPRQGIVAGSAAATCELMLLLARFFVFDRHAVAHPRIVTDIHVDDIAKLAKGTDPKEVARQMANSSRDFADMQEEVGVI